jgi:hypothetical protein
MLSAENVEFGLLVCCCLGSPSRHVSMLQERGVQTSVAAEAEFIFDLKARLKSCPVTNPKLFPLAEGATRLEPTLFSKASSPCQGI